MLFPMLMKNSTIQIYWTLISINLNFINCLLILPKVLYPPSTYICTALFLPNVEWMRWLRNLTSICLIYPNIEMMLMKPLLPLFHKRICLCLNFFFIWQSKNSLLTLLIEKVQLTPTVSLHHDHNILLYHWLITTKSVDVVFEL